MGLVDWALGGFADIESRGRTRKSHYEPWIVLAMEGFEREMLAFYRRSQFKIVHKTAA
ncbi:hypothetical protein [Rhizobium sp. P44RR-XXIV]|uniref:hypothetical protein n=1 Tax=Rhizobium sp. P44RR-XXIV TaxID=1921145 RepID=UPI00145B00E8|nr:hypothetical protein [Rhizobium sp. P44RR-XXIV]